MNKQEIIELIEAVRTINEQLYEGHENDEYIMQLSVCTDGMTTIVEWNEIRLWSSEEDDREWVEESTEEKKQGQRELVRYIPAHYEPIEGYLRRKCNELITNLSKIKL